MTSDQNYNNSGKGLPRTCCPRYELAWPKGLSRIICVLASPDHRGSCLILYEQVHTLFSLAVKAKEKKKRILRYFVFTNGKRFPQASSVYFHEEENASSLHHISTNTKVEKNLYLKTGLKCHFICDEPIRNCACTQCRNNF